jgi:hypothetical protein
LTFALLFNLSLLCCHVLWVQITNYMSDKLQAVSLGTINPKIENFAMPITLAGQGILGNECDLQQLK